MTRKELQKQVQIDRVFLRELIKTEDPTAQLLGVCHGIAREGCYNHHERGQRLWSLFQALQEEGLA